MTTPTSTYRLQLRAPAHPEDDAALTFADAAALVPQLATLGISHLYLSPIFEAQPGSTHGYDVVDPTRVAEGLGGRKGLIELSRVAHEAGLGLIVDIVPNHLGVADPRMNAWWWDVLTYGAQSDYASMFDLDLAADNGAAGRLALPVLGNEEDVAALTIDTSGAEPLLAFYEHRFPIRPGTLVADDPQATHDAQAYQLVSWRSDLVSYRRFFTVTELAAVRQEDPTVFAATHAEVLDLLHEGVIDGLRIDHPDGLADPAGYLARLRAAAGNDAWIVIEKILGAHEPLDPSLPVDGTTGYDALRLIDGLFVDPRGQATLTALAAEMGDAPGMGVPLDERVHAAEKELKATVVTESLRPELRRLCRAIRRDAVGSGAAPGVTSDAVSDTASGTGTALRDADLESAVAALIAEVPVYRSDYSVLAGMTAAALNRVLIDRPDTATALRLVGAALARGGEAATRFQQVCGAATAKAVEDCLFYRLTRLVSLQEVGGDPSVVGLSPSEVDLALAERARDWPTAMTTLSTHDTKRGEDVRARISVLAQVPDLWTDTVRELARACPPPHAATAAFLLQNFVGVWPDHGEVDRVRADKEFRRRLHDYAEKATREAALRTAWTDGDEAFETALHEWIDALLDGEAGEALTGLVAVLSQHGRITSLGMKLLALCAPGVPDIYQGTEVWEDSLVDPDNRRPVDHAAVARLMDSTEPISPVAPDGRAKLAVVHAACTLRRERPEAFSSYVPVRAVGEGARHLVGFGRGERPGQADILALATRFTEELSREGWRGTQLPLPPGVWTDRLTGRTLSGTVAADELLQALPVALLVRGEVTYGSSMARSS